MVNSGILFSVFFKGTNEYIKFHFQGDHKPGKLREFLKLLKSLGNFNFCRKNLENSGKMKNMGHDRQQKYISLNSPLELLSEKI